MAEDTKTQVASKLIDSTPALLIVLGAAFVVLAISKGITYHSWLPIVDPPSRITAGIFGAALIGLGLFGVKPRAATPKAKDYGIRIDHPKPGDRVNRTDVRGSIKKALPDGYTLKVFRIYPGESFFPMRDCRVDIDRGEWEAAGCDLASAKSDEKRAFAVCMVGVSGSALIKYLRSATNVHNSVRDELRNLTTKDVPFLPLIEDRTLDMIECDRVDVRQA